jgi:uncharacterized protein YdaU (DUF1376 family)
VSFGWHPREHRKALDGMLMLTLEERGAYNTCLDLIYDREGPIPDDARWLSGWMGVSARKWFVIRASLIVKGKLYEVSLNGLPSLMNQRASIELENQANRARKLRENGAKGGRRVAENEKNDSKNNGEPQALGSAKVQLKTKTQTETEEPTTTNAPDWREMLDEAKEAIGDAADLTRPAMHHAADLRALVEPKTGEPCTWAEVIDAIRMVAMRQKAKGKLVASWSWVRDDAIALRDKRLNAANPGVAEVIQLRATGPPSSIADRIAAEQAEARRRVLSDGK